MFRVSTNAKYAKTGLHSETQAKKFLFPKMMNQQGNGSLRVEDGDNMKPVVGKIEEVGTDGKAFKSREVVIGNVDGVFQLVDAPAKK